MQILWLLTAFQKAFLNRSFASQALRVMGTFLDAAVAFKKLMSRKK